MKPSRDLVIAVLEDLKDSWQANVANIAAKDHRSEEDKEQFGKLLVNIENILKLIETLKTER